MNNIHPNPSSRSSSRMKIGNSREDDNNSNNFPVLSLTPKRDTGILNFLRKYPESDGRGVTIAVLDTGVDPAAPGLQVTSEGKPKVIERYDCSGSGDVSTTSVVIPDEDGFIFGASGRKLKIPKEWDNPSGSFNVGVKSLYELYTPKVKERAEAKRKEQNWESGQRLALSDATNAANSFNNNKQTNAKNTITNGANNIVNMNSSTSNISISSNKSGPTTPRARSSSPTPTAAASASASRLVNNTLEKMEVETNILVEDKVEMEAKILENKLEKEEVEVNILGDGKLEKEKVKAKSLVDDKLEKEEAEAKSLGDEKLEKEEVEAKIEVLDMLDKKYKDWGPLLDCILFRDSTSTWQVALSLTTDLSTVKLLREYKIAQEYMELTPFDKMTVSVNVWDLGTCLEIVGMSGSHGTHVSSIAAGYFPENPSMNGVAPGAQVISLSVGDNRLGSMETGTALSRAMAFLMKNSGRVDVINMSYGEHAAWCSTGRIGELIREVVDKYGIPWVCSAGNHGPALSTVGTPPWICSNSMIGVGAYVSPEMMETEYSMRDKCGPMPYTWSSRGPTLDGEIGISVCAPGGAITSVPNFTLRNSQLMNGTSMSAPHVAGIIALLLCVAKERKIAYSPFSIKRALENSASPVKGADPFSVGAGLVQIEPALEKLTLYATSPELNVRFDIKVGGPTGNKGIYIRDPSLVQKEYNLTIEPVFLNSTNIDPEEKLAFRLNLILTSSASWVLVPDYLDIANLQRNFNVKVQLDGLPLGVHHAKIEAFDSSDVARGPVFTVHSTAIIPMEGTKVTHFPSVSCEPGVLTRHFVLVPKGATQATLSLRNETTGNTSRVVCHVMTLMQGQSCKSEEFYKMSTISSPDEVVHTFRVHERKVTEIVFGRWWADAKEPITVTASLAFKSYIVNKPEISISATDAVSRVNISTAFQSEEITPSIPLKNQVCAVRPTNVKIICLSVERDSFPNSRVVYELVAGYSFNVTRSTQLQVICPLVCDTLYEGEYESQLWMLFDNNKRYIIAGDAYPNKWTAKLEKGEYILRLHLRHEKREMLERFMNGYPNFQGDSILSALPVLLSFKLPAAINLSVHQSVYEAQVQKKGSGWNTTIKRGTTFVLIIGTHLIDKNFKQLPTNLQTHFFSGSLCLLPKEDKRSIPLRLFIPEPPLKLKSAIEKSKDELIEQMRDIKLNWMGKAGKEDSLKLYNELQESWPTYLAVYTTRISYLETLKKDTENLDIIPSLDEEMKILIDKVVSLTDKAQLLTYFGSKNSDTKLKSQMERNRNAYVEAIVKKGTLFNEDVEGCWTEVCTFFEPTDARVLDLSIKHAISRGQFGRAAKYLLKAEEKVENEKKILEVFESLGWKHAVWLMNENGLFKAAMKDYRPF